MCEKLGRQIAVALDEHRLWTYASAIAFRALVALVPLILLGLGLLSAFGLEDVWRNSVAPAIEKHVTPPVYRPSSIRPTRSSRAAQRA